MKETPCRGCSCPLCTLQRAVQKPGTTHRSCSRYLHSAFVYSEHPEAAVSWTYLERSRMDTDWDRRLWQAHWRGNVSSPSTAGNMGFAR